MKRREFFTTAATSVAGLMALTTFSFANTNGNTITIPELKNQHRRFTITQKHTPIAPLGSEGTTKLWIPLPEDTVFQRLISLNIEGNYDDSNINANNDFGVKTLCVT